MKKSFKILIFIILFSYFVLIPNKVVYADTYPYSNFGTHPCDGNTEGCIDPWSFYKRQCTSYAAWKVNESGIAFSNGMKGPNGTTGWFGNAGNWDNNAGNIGFSVDSNPTVGSVAVWNPRPGSPYYMDVGHVAWVESVNSNNTVKISEYNWNYGDGKYNTRTPSLNPDYYIKFRNSCGGQNVDITNKTVNSGQTYNCSATGSITVKPETTFQQGSDVRLYIN